VKWLLSFAIVLTASAGASTGAGASTSVNKPSVVFDGDSITVLATPAIHQILDRRYDVEVLAVDGIRIDQALPALELALKSHPYAVVENLGTNDALQDDPYADWVTGWQQLIQATKSTPCVVLTTVNPNADQLFHRPIATKINADIIALAARHPKKYKVANWSGFLSRHVSSETTYLEVQSLLIHPTPAGAIKLATLDRNALAKCGSRTS
jgi:GDSL-like lipase/acylhydrolase family protein